MKLQVDHVTHYRYDDEEVNHSIQYLRLTPPELPNQSILRWQLDAPEHVVTGLDAFGNITHTLTLDMPHQEIHLHAYGEARITGKDFPSRNEPFSPLVYLRGSPLTEIDPEVAAFANQFRGRSALHGRLLNMMKELLDLVVYEPGSTTVQSTATEAFADRRGVCQDHAHIFIACCRQLGVPARYVSGYIHARDDSHVSSHAWVETWLGRQWRTFDVSNNLSAPVKHLKLAVGYDYLDASPVRGVRFGGGEETMTSYAFVGRTTQQEQAQQ
jgi:transglutaminase-like putative cysteine protease